jgi:hypothetical protein
MIGHKFFLWLFLSHNITLRSLICVKRLKNVVLFTMVEPILHLLFLKLPFNGYWTLDLLGKINDGRMVVRKLWCKFPLMDLLIFEKTVIRVNMFSLKIVSNMPGPNIAFLKQDIKHLVLLVIEKNTYCVSQRNIV